jgi:hypothetical protein
VGFDLGGVEGVGRSAVSERVSMASYKSVMGSMWLKSETMIAVLYFKCLKWFNENGGVHFG